MPKILIRLIVITSLLMTGQACENEVQRPQVLVCPFETDGLYHENSKSVEYQALLDSYSRRGIPGAVLLVKDNSGFYVGASGMADIKNGIPMQPCHISKIASITKFMLGVSVLRLQEKGVLSLDDPISKYISGDKLNKISNGNEPLTIRNLMNHTAGLYEVIKDQDFYLQVLNNPSKHWSSDDLLKYVYHKNAAFDFRPADTAGYSNTNYLLLSMVIESATGKPHSATLHAEVIEPLGLGDTYYFWHDALPEIGIAQGYYDLYNNGELENLTQWNTASGNGYGGVYSTVWDMYKFIDALFIQKTLLSQASLDEMLVFHPDIESRKLLGVSCFKDFIDIGDPAKDYAWGHRGRDLSYSADLFYFPEHEATMALIVNYGTDGDSPLRPVFNEMRDKIAKLIVRE
ncbi:MAG: D-alanyl-D-alanine carboxypeptidase [Bacteroidetes bacterium]|nr:MAG: D-alanyl-D-alanine carboxypeptidase [Bacteroidota bacterium]